MQPEPIAESYSHDVSKPIAYILPVCVTHSRQTTSTVARRRFDSQQRCDLHGRLLVHVCAQANQAFHPFALCVICATSARGQVLACGCGYERDMLQFVLSAAAGFDRSAIERAMSAM